MSTFKCKMCGGTLEIQEGQTVAECEYCGAQQTVAKSRDEVISNLFSRANNLRMKSEFDRAEQTYEKILEQDNTEAEAHWGIVLCRYGIEYVEDPKTFKRIPTCHRTSYKAVTADADYLAALEYADLSQRAIYQAEAKAIDEIQKNILAIVKNEKPFDVFICYKESDETGRRTHDSVIANDIYHQLTQEGFKVFYAAITLEDKLGQAYEPYIFAALNSAKVMLVLGTKPEYFTAVWVKNEWSRFLQLMKNDRSKLLIPCYRDMDAYDLPEEFAHLQAQDMGKIGFINDVVRGIKKVVHTGTAAPTVVKEVIKETAGNANTAPLLKRAFLFLEDGDWDAADEYCEKVLDIDPENGEAYLGKLMAELQVRKREDLKNQAEPFDGKANYKKVLRYGDQSLQSTLADYIAYIKNRNEQQRLESIYSNACSVMNSANSADAYRRAAERFRSVASYKDSADKAKICNEKAVDFPYVQAVTHMKNAGTESKFIDVAEEFSALGNYKDSAALAKQCREKAKELHTKNVYSQALQKMQDSSVPSLEKAIDLLRSIVSYKNSEDLILKCQQKIEVLKKKQKEAENDRIYSAACQQMTLLLDYQRAIELFQSISGWKDADDKLMLCRTELAKLQENRRIEAIARAKRRKKKTVIAILIACLAAVCVLLAVFWGIPTIRYNSAISLMKDGRYSEAKAILTDLDGFGSSQGKIAVIDAMDEINDGNFDSAIKSILAANEFVTVEYDLNGGITNSLSTVIYASLADYSALLTSTKEGYRFVEWKLTQCGLGEDDTLKLVLQAVWTDGYFISYDLAGGTAENPTEYHKDGDSVHIENPVRTGYTFLGWTGTDLTEPTVELIIPTGSYGDRAYTANWKANRYTFTLDANGGTVGQLSVSAEYDSTYTLPTPSRDYYTFVGWYNDGRKFENGTWADGQDLLLTAKWQASPYKITYNLFGGTNSRENPEYLTIESAFSFDAPTKTGYRFVGWYCDAAYTEKITSVSIGSHQEISVYAKWEIITYYITYDLGGGSLSSPAKTTFTINDLPLALPSPEKAGVTFQYWTKDTFDGKIIDQIASIGDVTIVASYLDPYLEMVKVSNGYKVNSYTGSATSITIPAYYSGYPVVEIASNAFSSKYKITSIQIPSSVKAIGSYAFSGCSGLLEINIPHGITTIASHTFYKCESLSQINLPNSITSIGERAFGYCSSITTVDLPASVNSIGIGAFAGCKSLVSISLPYGITKVEYSTFEYCSSLKNIILPDTVTEIGSQAFGQSGLTKIIIPASVVKMGSYVFRDRVRFLTIYCRATAKPNGWESSWNWDCITNPTAIPVIWGYTGD